LGVTPLEWRYIGVFHEAGTDGWPGVVLHVYEVTHWSGAPRNIQPEEHEEIRWFSIEDACRLDLAHPAYPALFRSLEVQSGESPANKEV
ncbi:MAG TPA: NUDIX hydrolase, partial [Chloroflexia bacterium]|nr:NUDIX hydrolase [Chloroflexia bacterium]